VWVGRASAASSWIRPAGQVTSQYADAVPSEDLVPGAVGTDREQVSGVSAVTQTVDVAVVVVTYCRTDTLRSCLEHLARLDPAPAEVVVVDSSPDRRSEEVVRQVLPRAAYLRNGKGRGATATARRIGTDATTAAILAFVDDDAYADPDWLAELLVPYADPAVGAVGGRASRPGVPIVDVGPDDIGRLRDDGTLTGHFDVVLPEPVAVDHLLGCNMSFRRTAVNSIGGIHDGYPGTCLREESDLCLRVGRAGWRLVYVPTAHVVHVAAPYAKGKRFDRRYRYYAQRNHLVLLTRVLGPRSPTTTRYLRSSVCESVAAVAAALIAPGRSLVGGRSANDAERWEEAARHVVGRAVDVLIVLAATPVGLAAGIVHRWADGRRTHEGRERVPIGG